MWREATLSACGPVAWPRRRPAGPPRPLHVAQPYTNVQDKRAVVYASCRRPCPPRPPAPPTRSFAACRLGSGATDPRLLRAARPLRKGLDSGTPTCTNARAFARSSFSRAVFRGASKAAHRADAAGWWRVATAGRDCPSGTRKPPRRLVVAVHLPRSLNDGVRHRPARKRGRALPPLPFQRPRQAVGLFGSDARTRQRSPPSGMGPLNTIDLYQRPLSVTDPAGKVEAPPSSMGLKLRQRQAFGIHY